MADRPFRGIRAITEQPRRRAANGVRYDDARHWLRAAASRVGHLFPQLLSQGEYNVRLRAASDLMEDALR